MRTCGRLALTVLLLIASMLAGCPKTPTTTMANSVIRVVPSKSYAQPGEQIDVVISVEPGSGANVAGIQFDLAFNPQSVKIDSVAEGNFLNQGGAPTFFHPGTIDNTNGKLAPVWGVVIGAGQVLANPGDFVLIKCTAVNATTSSAFALSNVIIGDKDGNPVPFELSTGQVDVILLGDLNGDGEVNLADMTIIRNMFGSTGAPGFDITDLKKDGIVNVLDAITLGQHIA